MLIKNKLTAWGIIVTVVFLTGYSLVYHGIIQLPSLEDYFGKGQQYIPETLELMDLEEVIE